MGLHWKISPVCVSIFYQFLLLLKFRGFAGNVTEKEDKSGVRMFQNGLCIEQVQVHCFGTLRSLRCCIINAQMHYFLRYSWTKHRPWHPQGLASRGDSAAQLLLPSSITFPLWAFPWSASSDSLCRLQSVVSRVPSDMYSDLASFLCTTRKKQPTSSRYSTWKQKELKPVRPYIYLLSYCGLPGWPT